MQKLANSRFTHHEIVARINWRNETKRTNKSSSSVPLILSVCIAGIFLYSRDDVSVQIRSNHDIKDSIIQRWVRPRYMYANSTAYSGSRNKLCSSQWLNLDKVNKHTGKQHYQQVAQQWSHHCICHLSPADWGHLWQSHGRHHRRLKERWTCGWLWDATIRKVLVSSGMDSRLMNLARANSSKLKRHQSDSPWCAFRDKSGCTCFFSMFSNGGCFLFDVLSHFKWDPNIGFQEDLPNIQCSRERQPDLPMASSQFQERPGSSWTEDCRVDTSTRHTEVTGRTFAYKSSSFRRATMGEEYPTTLWEGELQYRGNEIFKNRGVMHTSQNRKVHNHTLNVRHYMWIVSGQQLLQSNELHTRRFPVVMLHLFS